MAEANFSLTNILSSPTVTGDTHVLIDTIQCSLFDMEIPSIPPSLSVIGRVHSKAEKMGDGIHLGCELDVSKYVRDAMHEFKIQYVFNSFPHYLTLPCFFICLVVRSTCHSLAGGRLLPLTPILTFLFWVSFRANRQTVPWVS